MSHLSQTVAVIGMAVRFPDASTPDSFWRNLASGRISLTRFAPRQLMESGVSPADMQHQNYIPVKGILDSVDQFDAGFFGWSDRDAALTDPQHRLFTELAWEAFEDAGYDPGRSLGRIGVFASGGKNTYLIRNLLGSQDWQRSPEIFQLLIGNEKDYLAAQAAAVLDATGPVLSVQSACSSSLVAVHLACQSLLAGECDFALAGGVCVDPPSVEGYWHFPGSILSDHGECLPFTPRATGTVFGQGAAAIVLRRFDDVRRDTIRALIRGTAVNNEGERASFSAPSTPSQVSVVVEALSVGGVAAEEIGYIEAHGTATLLGDQIEMAALEQVFENVARPVAVGTVKANLGHCGAAAGIAGLCKTILARQQGKLPPAPQSPGADLALGGPGSPLYLNSTMRDWPSAAPCAGISSFGQGGTNAHVVLDAPPSETVPPPEDSVYPFVISARTSAELEARSQQLGDSLRRCNLPLGSIAWTLFAGRRTFEYRRVILASTQDELLLAMDSRDSLRVADARVTSQSPRVEILLTASGATLALPLMKFPEYKSVVLAGRQKGMSDPQSAQHALVQLWTAWGVPMDIVRTVEDSGREAFARSGLPASAQVPLPASQNVQFALAPRGAPFGRLSPDCAGNTLRVDAIAALFGRLWLIGLMLNPQSSLFPQTARRVPLPTYPFARRSFWIGALSSVDKPHSSLTQPSPMRDDLTQAIQQLFAKSLGRDNVRPDDDYFELGGNSLSALTIIAGLEELLGASLKFDCLMAHPTPAGLAQSMQCTSVGPSIDELFARIDVNSYRPVPPSPPRPTKSVLLTGATGFLGIHLLEELLTRTDARVTCLVRANANQDAPARLAAAAKRYKAGIEMSSPRLCVVECDLRRDRMGLPASVWEQLSAESDTMIHAAAEVDLLRSYRALRDSNVRGFQNVLAMADRSGMTLHVTSSVAVFECETFRQSLLVREETELSQARGYHNGYSLGKWTVELMASRRTVPTFIHRVSNLGPHPIRDFQPDGQILMEFLRCCLSLGCAPGEFDHLNVIPVNVAANWIVRIVMQQPRFARFHIVNPNAVAVHDVIQWLRNRGHVIEFRDEMSWQKMARRRRDERFGRFSSILDRKSLFSNRDFGLVNTRRVIGGRVVNGCPVIDEELLNRHYDSLISSD